MKVLQSILTKGWVTTYADPIFEEFGEMSELDQRFYVFGDHKIAPSRHQYNVYYKDNGNLVIAVLISYVLWLLCTIAFCGDGCLWL